MEFFFLLVAVVGAGILVGYFAIRKILQGESGGDPTSENARSKSCKLHAAGEEETPYDGLEELESHTHSQKKKFKKSA